MNIFIHIERVYKQIDNDYAVNYDNALEKGYTHEAAQYARRRELNDHAYFLFMFTRLEDKINILSDGLIDAKMKTLTDWKIKRSWEILQKRIRRLDFMNRVSLLTPTGGANYNLINQYYKECNSIAHGGDFTIPLHIPKVIEDMKRLYKVLKG